METFFKKWIRRGRKLTAERKLYILASSETWKHYSFMVFHEFESLDSFSIIACNCGLQSNSAVHFTSASQSIMFIEFPWSKGPIFIFPQHGCLDAESLSVSQPDLLMVSHFKCAPTVFSQRPSELGRTSSHLHTTSCLFLPVPDENPWGRKLSQINTRPSISSYLLPKAVQLYFKNMCIV